MCGIGHVKLLGMKSRRKREKAALCGCGLLENVAELLLQRCRRTRRDPSSSNERRRKVARSWVRLKIMSNAHTAERRMVSRVIEVPQRRVSPTKLGPYVRAREVRHERWPRLAPPRWQVLPSPRRTDHLDEPNARSQ